MFTRRLMPLLALLFLALWLVAPVHAQRGDGQLTVTLLDHTGAPVAGEPLTFLTGDKQPLATCTTDAVGTCTLVLTSAPTDASGFIRGSVLVRESRRPVLWPGGALAIQIQQDVLGHVNPPADVYTVHDPVATLAAEATLAALPVLPGATGAGGQGPGPRAEPTQATTAVASPRTTPPATETPSTTATSVPAPTELAARAPSALPEPDAPRAAPTRSPIQNLALAIAVCLISAAFVLFIGYALFPERAR